MTKGFPCPNPTCSHTFPADAITGAASLSCPACGTVMQFRQAAPTPRPATKPAPPRPVPPARAVVPPPVAAPVAPVAAPAAPVAAPVMDEPRFELAFSEPDLSVPESGGRAKKRPRRSGMRASILKWAIVLQLVACMVGVAIYFVNYVLPTLVHDEPAKEASKANLSYKSPAGWRSDKTLMTQMKANMALSRSKPRGHLALHFHDYKFRLPSDAELVEEAVKRLKAYFPRLEYIDPLQTGGKGRTGELGGEKALKLTFKATAGDEVPMVGECQMTARRGYGYWFVAWGPEEDADELPDTWEKLRAGLSFGDGREGWKPTPRPATPFVLEEAGLLLDYPHDEWKKEESPKDWDSAAELVLRGYDLSVDERGKLRRIDYAGKLATMQVLALPRAADLKAGVAAARALVQKKYADINDSNKLEPYLDRGTGKPLVQHMVGTEKGEVHHLEVVQGDAVGDAVLLAVVNTAKATVAFYCASPPERRGYWSGEFKAILDSVRRK